MIERLRRFFDRNVRHPAEAGGDEAEHALRLATAALLVEMSRMDDRVTDAERAAIERALRGKFHLSPEEAADLVELAEAEAREATSYFGFTSLINKYFSPWQKAQVIELLWQVAYADGHLEKYEEHLVRRIADLLHVPHREFIGAKLRARGEA